MNVDEIYGITPIVDAMDEYAELRATQYAIWLHFNGSPIAWATPREKKERYNQFLRSINKQHNGK